VDPFPCSWSCPHHSKRMINASVGGNYLNKTTTQVKTIIEDLAASERIIETY